MSPGIGRRVTSVDGVDYGAYHDLESYVFGIVGPRFRDNGHLSAFDFFCIIIWKANRAKSYHARRLLRKGHKDLDTAVKALTSGLTNQTSDEMRFRYLFKDWGFGIATASAILAVLYPDDFTIYDYRVCQSLKDFDDLAHLISPENAWRRYLEYMRAVKLDTPEEFSLRDKDRYLWGKSFHDQLRRDIRNGFPKAGEEDRK